MGDISGGLLLFGAFFGLEIVAIFILIISALCGRQLVFVIVCGSAAAVVMAAESVILFICVATGHADLPGNATLIIVSAVSIVGLGVYFPIAIMRCKRKQRSDAHNAA